MRTRLLIPTILIVASLAMIGFGVSRGTATPLPTPVETHLATLHPDHVGATNPGFPSEGDCPAEGWGWHFVLQGNDSEFVSISVTFQNAGTITIFDPNPNAKHAYVYTPGPDTLTAGTAMVTGSDTNFNLSHICNGPDGTTTTTAEETTTTVQETTTTAEETTTTVAETTTTVEETTTTVEETTTTAAETTTTVAETTTLPTLPTTTTTTEVIENPTTTTVAPTTTAEEPTTTAEETTTVPTLPDTTTTTEVVDAPTTTVGPTTTAAPLPETGPQQASMLTILGLAGLISGLALLALSTKPRRID